MDISLIKACQDGDLKEVKSLIEKGANLEIVDGRGYTPILFASWKDHLEVAKFLVEVGNADIQDKNDRGETALYIASLKGYISLRKERI